LLKTSDILSFALMISSDASRSKAQFNTVSLEEYIKTDIYCAENI